MMMMRAATTKYINLTSLVWDFVNHTIVILTIMINLGENASKPLSLS